LESRSSRCNISSSKPGRHLSVWLILGWTSRIRGAERRRVPGEHRPDDEGAGEDRHAERRGAPPAPPREEEQGAGREHHDPGKAVRPDQLGGARKARGVEQNRAFRVPGEAGEHRAAHPFGDDPEGCEPEHQRQRVASPIPPGDARGERRIDGEVEREEDDRDPAEPVRHRRLEGEGGGDPVEPDREVPDREPPAERKRAPQPRRVLDEPHQPGKGDEGQRPEPPGLEPERARGADQQCDEVLLHAGAHIGDKRLHR
jgi:hypothetical protein